MRRHSLLSRAILAAILISAAGTAFAETWRTYYNDRYGTTIEYPDYFQPGNPPDANDGLAFRGPDGASFSVSRHTTRSTSIWRAIRISS
jgi:hypothetical protein